MTGHEQSGSEQPRLDFMQSFGARRPDISRMEQLAVGRLFDTFVDDLFLDHIMDVNHSTDNVRHWSHSSLPLTVDSDYGMWHINIVSSQVAERSSAQLGSLPEKGISLVFFDDGNNEREQYNYSLDSDGVVRRRDLGDIMAEQPMELSYEELLAGGSDGGGEDLEEELGMNNQPISLRELAGLERFVMGARPRPR